MAEWKDEMTREWRKEELREIISNEEWEAVQQVRFSASDSPNFLVWYHTKNGEFSVRSAYHLKMQRRDGSVGGSNGDPIRMLWKRIWEAKVPQKVKKKILFGEL